MNPFEWDRRTLRRNLLMALGLLSIFLVVHEIFGEHGYLALRRQERTQQALQGQIEKLKRENLELEQQIKALKSDPQAIEKLAREQMRLARPGEIIYALPRKDPKAESPSTAAKANPPQP